MGKDLPNIESGSAASNWEPKSKTTENGKVKIGSSRGHSLTKENAPSNVTEVGTKSLTPPPIPDRGPLRKKLNEKKINTLESQMNEAKKKLDTCQLMVGACKSSLELAKLNLESGNLAVDSEEQGELISILKEAEKGLKEAEEECGNAQKHFDAIKKEHAAAVKAAAPKSIVEVAPESKIEESKPKMDPDEEAVNKQLHDFELELNRAQQGLKNESKEVKEKLGELELAHTDAKRFFKLFKKNCDLTNPQIFKSRSKFSVSFNENKRCIEVGHPLLEKKAFKRLEKGDSQAYREQLVLDLKNMLK